MCYDRTILINLGALLNIASPALGICNLERALLLSGLKNIISFNFTLEWMYEQLNIVCEKEQFEIGVNIVIYVHFRSISRAIWSKYCMWNGKQIKEGKILNIQIQVWSTFLTPPEDHAKQSRSWYTDMCLISWYLLLQIGSYHSLRK